MANNAFTKGLAGLGTGMAQVGFMTYKENLDEKLLGKRDELMTRRDKTLNGYAEGLQASRIEADVGIAESRVAVTKAGHMARSEDARLGRETDVSIAEGKVESAEKIAEGKLGKAIRLSDETVFVDGEFKMQRASGDKKGPPSEREKFTLQQKGALNRVLNSLHPGLYESLTGDDKKEFNHLYIEASKLIDGGMNHSEAYEQVLGAWSRAKDLEKISGKSSDSSASSDARSRFNY